MSLFDIRKRKSRYYRSRDNGNPNANLADIFLCSLYQQIEWNHSCFFFFFFFLVGLGVLGCFLFVRFCFIVVVVVDVVVVVSKENMTIDYPPEGIKIKLMHQK